MRRLILGVALLFLCVKSYGLTRGDAETEIRYLIKDANPSLQRYTDTVLDSFINAAQREIASETFCIQTSTGIILTPGVTTYGLPSDFIAFKLVVLKPANNRTRFLTEVSQKSVFENNPDFANQSGPPMQYFSRYSTIAPGVAGSESFKITPIPTATASSTGTMTVTYYAQAPDLTSDLSVLFGGYTVLVPYHEAVVYKVVAKIKGIESDIPGSTYYFQLYGNMVSLMVGKLNTMPNFTPSITAGTSSNSH